ncbi:P-loop containing nucleoside triphosphate hydrolase protein [Xylariaceae sp. AK1471]|nr:P-loop containing nucleoside triphosphate hydrolase protein [Xylariaceae sp. AK1471]
MNDVETPPIEPYLPPLNFLQSQPNNKIGTNCELRQYERIKNSKGEKIILRHGSSRPGVTRLQDEWSAQSALVLIKEIDDKDCLRTELEIQSPYMKAALKSCVPAYEKLDIERKSVILHDEPRCVFHYRQELIDYHLRCINDNDRPAASHVKFLLDHMFNTLNSEIRHFTQYMENPRLQPSLDYFSLWMAFVPGDIIYVKQSRYHSQIRGRLLRLDGMSRCPCATIWCPRYSWSVQGYMIDYDGTDFGHWRKTISIDPYEGVKALQDLKVMPLRYHPDQETIRAQFIERGEKFIHMQGRHYQQYKGVAHLLSDERLVDFTGEDDYFPLRATHVNGRIMVDCEAFSEARSSHQPYLLTTEKSFKISLGQHLEMSDNELMICADAVAGYALNEKKWGWFRVDTIRDVEFDEDAFDSLILQDGVKQMLYSLVRSHGSDDLAFNDVITGKGKGLSFLLHGEPGTGKTLTAESVADYIRMPLLRMDTASLGSSMVDVERNLAATFELAEKWRAIALLDEADIFLEQRGPSDLERNRLVAAFLRAIEYFGGILFLTTNRVESFDRAFRSRIHLALYYPALNANSRSKIWKTFLSRPKCEVETELLDITSLDHISREDLNGREIRNAVHMANSLAANQKRPINSRDE